MCWAADPAEALRVETTLAAPFRSVLDRRGVDGGSAADYHVHAFPSAVLIGADGRIERRRVLVDVVLGFDR